MISQSLLHCLLLVIVANASPIILRNLIGTRFDAPVDGGLRFIDGRPLLGASKTWRGIWAAVLLTALLALLLGHPPQLGAQLALLAMAGDLLSSFIKRRLQLPPSAMAPLVDQIPESFLPAWLLAGHFGLSDAQVGLLVILFIVFELGSAVILYRWGIRKRPY